MARIGSAAIAALLVAAVGCLFPSIDALEGSGGEGADAGVAEAAGDAKKEILCNDRNCQIPVQLCCAGVERVSCVGPETPCDGMRIACDGDEDCAGTNERTCCLVDGRTIGCQAACGTPVCTKDEGRCTAGKTCKDVAGGGGHKACQE